MRRALIAAAILAAVTAHAQRPFGFGISQTEQVTRGLVSYWSMRNSGTTVFDEKGSNNGSASNSPTFSAANGVVGNGVGLDGATQYITMGNVLADTFGGADKKFSIAAWVMFAATGNWYVIAAKYNANINQRGFLLRRGNGKLAFDFENKAISDYRTVLGSTTLSESVWYHCAVVYDGAVNTNDGLDRVKLYVNGARETESLFETFGALVDIQVNTASLAIGAVGGGPGQGFEAFINGRVDEVRIYNVLLDPDEIKQLYRMGAYVYANR